MRSRDEAPEEIKAIASDEQLASKGAPRVHSTFKGWRRVQTNPLEPKSVLRRHQPATFGSRRTA